MTKSLKSIPDDISICKVYNSYILDKVDKGGIVTKMTLQFNPATSEPYIRLPAPHSNIIITPARPTEDAPELIESLNDPKVYNWLEGPPYPYTQADADSWLNCQYEKSNKVQEQMKMNKMELDKDHDSVDEGDERERRYLSDCPVNIIREIREGEDGVKKEVYAGSACFERHKFEEVADREARARLMKINDEREVGDENITWSMGDSLAPSLHGRGVMTAVIKILVEWAMKNMNVHNISVVTHEGNIGSRRVFEKNGFFFVRFVKDAVTIPEAKGGGKRSHDILSWQKPARISD